MQHGGGHQDGTAPEGVGQAAGGQLRPRDRDRGHDAEEGHRGEAEASLQQEQDHRHHREADGQPLEERQSGVAPVDRPHQGCSGRGNPATTTDTGRAAGLPSSRATSSSRWP